MSQHRSESSLLEQFKHPEYTGENRCTPCTIANVAIATVASGAIALYSPSVAASVFILSAAAIYFRGYLVPYTPTMTKRYFPDRVLRWFEKQPESAWETEEEGLVDVEQTLASMNIVRPCESKNDLCLSEDFREEWQWRMSTLDNEEKQKTAIGSLLGVDYRNVSMATYGEAVVVRYDGRQVGQWESDAALLADIAADGILQAEQDEWRNLDPINRSRILNSLRMFLEQCPECGGPARLNQETVESCCREMEVAAVSCQECGVRLFEIELDDQLAAA